MASLKWTSIRLTVVLASLFQLIACGMHRSTCFTEHCHLQYFPGTIAQTNPGEVPELSTSIKSPIPRAVARALPETGKVHKYNFTISREHRAPDGLNRSLILVNGQFPGPTIEGNLGDYFEVTVTNRIASPAEGMYTTHMFTLSSITNPSQVRQSTGMDSLNKRRHSTMECRSLRSAQLHRVPRSHIGSELKLRVRRCGIGTIALNIWMVFSVGWLYTAQGPKHTTSTWVRYSWSVNTSYATDEANRSSDGLQPH